MYLTPLWHLYPFEQYTKHSIKHVDNFSEKFLVRTQCTRIQKQKQNYLSFKKKKTKKTQAGITQWNTQFRLLYTGINYQELFMVYFRNFKGKNSSVSVISHKISL